MINQTLLKKKNIAQCLGLMSSTDIRNVEILVPKLILGLGGGIAEGVMGFGHLLRVCHVRVFELYLY